MRRDPYTASLSRGAGVRVFVAQPVMAGEKIIGAVIASRTPLDAIKALFQVKGHLLKGTLVLLGVVMLMATLTAYYINRPVQALRTPAPYRWRPGRAEPLSGYGCRGAEEAGKKNDLPSGVSLRGHYPLHRSAAL